MKLLENKWALVTGASRGIGYQIALGLAKRKCNVIVHGRTLENTKQILKEARALGVKAYAAAGELADP
jgi:short-subunit dehydrogenase